MWEGRRWNSNVLIQRRAAVPAATRTCAKVGDFRSNLKTSARCCTCMAVITNTLLERRVSICFFPLFRMHYIVKANGIHGQIRATDPRLKHLVSRRAAETLDPERCSAARARSCAFCVCKPANKAAIVLLVKLSTLCARVCACGQLAEGSALPWKYWAKHPSRRRLGSSSLHHLGILTLWLGFSCRIFTHLASHVSPFRLSAFAPFIFFQVCIH